MDIVIPFKIVFCYVTWESRVLNSPSILCPSGVAYVRCEYDDGSGGGIKFEDKSTYIAVYNGINNADVYVTLQFIPE